MKAATALLKHVRSEAKRKEAEASRKSLIAASAEESDEEGAPGDDEPIWLTLTTKKHIVDKKRLKPGKVAIPHSLNTSPTTTICLITADPQRAFKDTIAHATFPSTLSKRITRVIGLKKLQERYKSFESRRQLLREHDVFLADDRIITRLPQALGKTFYKGSKKPIPVNLEAQEARDENGKRKKAAPSTDKTEKIASVAQPAQAAREIERALSAAQVHLSPSATTAVRVGLANFTPQQLQENIEAIVTGFVDKFVTNKWRNVRAIHIKGPNTMALPIWLAEELWVDEADVLNAEEAAKAIEAGNQKVHKRPKRELEEGGETKGGNGDERESRKSKRVKGAGESGMSEEMLRRREKLRLQKAEARETAWEGLGDTPKKAEDVDCPALPVTEEKVKRKSKKKNVAGAAVT